jgi:hypothetical protein
MFTAEAMLCIHESRFTMLREGRHDSSRRKWIFSAKWLHHGFVCDQGSSLYCGCITITITTRTPVFHVQRLWLCSVLWSVADGVKMHYTCKSKHGYMCTSAL